MATIAPFRALRYDPQRVSLSQVVTQPYDKITPDMQRKYYAASPYNLVRVILGLAQPGDNSQQNVYSRAALSFHDWRRQGIFLQDAEPSLYIYSQRFSMPNTKVIAPSPSPKPTGLTCCVPPGPTSANSSCFIAIAER